MPASVTCGVDIGGTFTDCVLLGGDGRRAIGKALSTPDDGFSSGFFASIAAAAERLGLSLDEVLGSAERIFSHGSTVATNIVVEREGARVGMLTTKGFEDTIRIMRGIGRPTGEPPENLLRMIETRKPVPLVPAERVRGIAERVDSEGEAIVALDGVAVAAAVEALLADGVEAIAIAYLWSIANPAHERRSREIVRELAPQAFVTISSDVSRAVGEYERFVATLINAYVGPVTSQYLRGVQGQLREAGFAGELNLMQCHGGMVPIEKGIERPVFTIGSGPVGGLVACAAACERLGSANIIATDMGGTSFDVGIVKDAEPLAAEQTVVGKFAYQVPSLEVTSIGAGGGSIAWIDPHSASLRVGPRSAGSTPGPVCFGRGGSEPTVTDANLVLGYIDPEARFGASEFGLDRDAAAAAIARVGEPLGLSVPDAALGIVEIANTAMANLLESEVIGRGFDPRDFVVMSYGGAGPLHAVAYARTLGIEKVVVPGEPASVWSAFGIALAEVRHQHELHTMMLEPFDAGLLAERFGGLEAAARADLGEGGELRRYVRLQFQWQIHELEMRAPPGPIDDGFVERFCAAFLKMYEERYGASALLPGARLQITGLRVEAARARHDGAAPSFAATARPAPARSRRVWFERGAGPTEVPVHDAASLPVGQVVAGPALVDLAITAILVPAASSCERSESGDFAVAIG